MAGLVFLADFLSWTAQEAVEAYIFRSDLQHTLNLEPVGSSGDTILHSEKLSMVSPELGYHVLDRDPTQVDVEAFFRRLPPGLGGTRVDRPGDHDRRLDAVPRTDRRSLRCGAASGLPIPHPARGEQGDPLGRGPGTQASGSRRPQIAAGPSQLEGGQACRSAQEADQAEGG